LGDLFDDSVNNADPDMVCTDRMSTRITGKGEDMQLIGRVSFNVSQWNFSVGTEETYKVYQLY